MRAAYRLDRQDIAQAIRMLCGLPRLAVNDAVRTAKVLDWYECGMDFTDAWHLASSEQCDALYTFDAAFVRAAKSLDGTAVRRL